MNILQPGVYGRRATDDAAYTIAGLTQALVQQQGHQLHAQGGNLPPGRQQSQQGSSREQNQNQGFNRRWTDGQQQR